MGIEFKKPLIIGDIDASVKSDISQLQQDIGDLSQLDTADKSSIVNAINDALDSTLNGASIDLDNLSTVGNDKLSSLNAYANEGKSLTDSDGLAFIKKYAHSTFDSSKFAVVGSANITDDGLASGFSSSNGIFSRLSIINHATWDISFKFTSPSTLVNGNKRIVKFLPNTSFMCCLDGSNLRVWLGNGSSWFIEGHIVTSSITTNTEYSIKIKFTGNAYEVYVNNVLTSTITSTTQIPQSITNIYIGYDASSTANYFTGSIDLKQFSITVDGVEVFSGNRTGVDTIKPDNYTVVGTPTVSADGIASGFSSSNYINIPNTYAVTSTSNIEFDISISKTSNPSASSPFMRVAKNDYRGTFGFLLGITAAGYLYTSGIVERSHAQLDNNRLYNIKLKCVNGVASIYLDGDLLYSGTYTTDVPTGYITIGAGTGSDYFQNGSFDLNALKIYTDGNLVYQSCLKIPYTESKTGSKIVDSIYRDRVADMATQFGYANYYTLDENVGNFTLPQVELYGLIGQRTLRDGYRNGINYWELYSNRDLEQGGSCTSGVEVTFARPFADTNYVLSVPYSAKSSTAFTPTQTGDWIAKGKGLL